ncbi:MAG: copper chaperone PCu(A)C [Acidimicrobiales bacterium]
MRTNRPAHPGARSRAILLATLALSACSTQAPTPASHDAPRPSGHLRVIGASIDRPVAPVAAVRLAIDNGTTRPDRLVAIRTPDAATATLHVNGRDAQGRTLMRQVASVALPPEHTTYFAPGLRHVMLSGLRRRLRVGDHVRLVLRFQRAGTIVVDAPVRSIPTSWPRPAPAAGHGPGADPRERGVVAPP